MTTTETRGSESNVCNPYPNGSAGVPKFNAIVRESKATERDRYIRYHAENLERCIEQGKPDADVQHYAGHLAQLLSEDAA